MTLVRISKLLSNQGVCSRREADHFIELGFVYVDGIKVTENLFSPRVSLTGCM